MKLDDQSIRKAVRLLEAAKMKTEDYQFVFPIWTAFLLWFSTYYPQRFREIQVLETGNGLHDKRTKAYKLLSEKYTKFQKWLNLNSL